MAKKIFTKIVNRVVDSVMGNGVMQDTSGGLSKSTFSNKDIADLINRAGKEGIILLKNDNKALPLNKEDNVSIFGRCQLDTFYVGYGSGGDVKYPYRVSYLEGLLNEEKKGNIKINHFLMQSYVEWTTKSENTPDDGWWGHWPMNYPEMPITKDMVNEAADFSTKAIVIIGRAAGEDRENVLEKGSYYLTDEEEYLLSLVTKRFSQTIVVINSGNIIDFSWIEKYSISSVVLAWQGGMESGNSLAEVLTGSFYPSGKLTSTIAKTYDDYPSSKYFGGKKYNNYSEDIYVGYRYFNTFCSDKILFPFGFGLSYTDFKIESSKLKYDSEKLYVKANVKNVGSCAGKEVIQIYVKAPIGKLGNPSIKLLQFYKTNELKKKEEEIVSFEIAIKDLSSYDDTGVTGNKNSYVIEAGEYEILVGSSSINLESIGKYFVRNTIVVSTNLPICGVKESFERMVNSDEGLKMEKVPVSSYSLHDRIVENLPKEIGYNKDNSYSFSDVISNKITVEEFVSSLSNKELEALTRGFGTMNAFQGPKGNAGTYGGVIPSLVEKNVPTVATTDGPAGIRLHASASLLPCGTMLASSFNLNLVEELYRAISKEMLELKTNVLLAPGMNIQRNPLCGRNFEYFSEDPLVSGKIAAACVRGIQSNKNTMACPKHFACNNQETRRNTNDSRVSERALREIYLKGFEICINESKPKVIMTSYNKINGVWAHYNYDLVTTLLRNEWGYEGLVITDWWMRKSKSPEFKYIKDNAYRVRAGVDVLMPGNMSYIKKKYSSDGTLLKKINTQKGITRAEVEMCAIRTLNNILGLEVEGK